MLILTCLLAEDATCAANIFECQCSFAGLITSGTNQKKKSAKHLASEMMLRVLEERGMVKGLRCPSKPYLGVEDDNFDNPISKLFEFLQIRGLFLNIHQQQPKRQKISMILAIEKPVFWDDLYGTQFKVTCTIASLKLETSGLRFFSF